MSSAIERVIAESLEALESGRSIEEILAEHPEQVETLRPILATAAKLASLKIAHSIGAQSNSLDQFLGAASTRKAAGAGSKRPLLLFGRRLAVSLSVILLLLIIISFPITLAAQSAIPGDALYNAKVAIEDIRLSLVREGVGRDKLTDVFNQNRIEEIDELIASGRSESGIEFTGIVEAIDGQVWIISGLPVIVSESLASSGQIKIGQDVIVVVDIRDGEVEATRIIKPSSLENLLEPGPITTKEAGDDVEPGPEALPTLEETDTATRELSETPEPTISPTPAPDKIIGLEATSTLESDDHDDSGEDEDSDDLDDDNHGESDDSSGSGDDDSANDDGEGSGSGSDDDDGEDDGDEDDGSDSDDDSSRSSDEEDDEEDEEDEEDEKGDKGGG